MPILTDPGLFSSRGYLAPTVYLLPGVTSIGHWNYYDSLQKAADKYAFLQNKGGANWDPAGQVAFDQTTGSAQTMGINCDFYILQAGQWVMTTYADLKDLSTWPPLVAMMYLTDGSGPVFTIVDSHYFGLSATTTANSDPQTVAALDDFYRQTTLLKYRYNALVGFLNTMAARQLGPEEQQIFNEGTLKLQSLNAEISQINGIAITYTANGSTIGNPLLIILIILILAAATAWAITDIVNETQKTQRINDAYQLDQWIAAKKLAIAQLVNSGSLTQAQADQINTTLDQAASTGNKIANNSAASGGMFDSLISLAKWGVLGFLVFKGFEIFGSKKQ